MKRTRKITYILDPDRRQQVDLARFGAIRDSLPKPPTTEEYEAASASELATMNLVLHANQLVLRILGALRTQGRYDSRDADLLGGLVREISMLPHAVRDVKRRAAQSKTNTANAKKLRIKKSVADEVKAEYAAYVEKRRGRTHGAISHVARKKKLSRPTVKKIIGN